MKPKHIDREDAVLIVKQLGVHYPQILIEMAQKVGRITTRKREQYPNLRQKHFDD